MEPLMSSSFPCRPWQRVASDLYDFHGQEYIIVVDYYSRWFEIRKLRDETSKSAIEALKEIFAIHGIPDQVMSDNGPQYDAECFREFAATYGFTHVTSSPIYPQGNGKVERAIRTAKTLLKKNDDFHNALLIYRTTPRQNAYGLSPSESLMGRRLRTQLPVHPVNLQPSVTTDSLRTVNLWREKKPLAVGSNKTTSTNDTGQKRPSM